MNDVGDDEMGRIRKSRLQVAFSKYGSEDDVMEWLVKIKQCDGDSIKMMIIDE